MIIHNQEVIGSRNYLWNPLPKYDYRVNLFCLITKSLLFSLKYVDIFFIIPQNSIDSVAGVECPKIKITSIIYVGKPLSIRRDKR